MKNTDQILISDLQLSCHIGVPDDERAQSQDLLVSVTLFPESSPEPLEDDIARTVDYYAVSLRLDAIAREKSRKLIETLAEDFATRIMTEFAVSAVTIEIKKFILPNTRYVGVLISRERKDLVT
jgi:FolB domain-containing protein